MNNDIDLKKLWANGGQTTPPNLQEIIKRGAQLQRKTRNRIIFGNLIPLALTIVFISWVWAHYNPQMLTTKIGLVLVIGDIVFYLIASMGLLNLLYKNDLDGNVTEFLLHFLKLKQKQESLNTTTLSVYFALLSIGIFLYMLEYAGMMGVVGRSLAYGITAAWIALNWFYLRPRAIKKQADKLNKVIDKLQSVTGQIAEG